MKELSLRPYNGKLYLASSKRDYEISHKKIFKEPDILQCNQVGRFSGGCGNDDVWTYLVYASSKATLAHELSHVVLHVFERCGIDPRDAGGEPFCYMISQLLIDSNKPKD